MSGEKQEGKVQEQPQSAVPAAQKHMEFINSSLSLLNKSVSDALTDLNNMEAKLNEAGLANQHLAQLNTELRAELAAIAKANAE